MNRATLVKVIGAAAVVVMSFVITLKILGSRQSDLPAGPIAVVDATYGLNCEGAESLSQTKIHVEPGNATKAVAEECNGAMEECVFAITGGKISDPAPGCMKDFSVAWRCGNAATIQHAHRGKPAGEKSITLKCLEE